MTWPRPEPGLVVRYVYLWSHEAEAGRDEGSKDRPCAVVLTIGTGAASARVAVLPITTTRPRDEHAAIELPPSTRQRLGLDGERCWVVINEANVFTWPGPDLRFVDRGRAVHGVLPPGVFRAVRDRFVRCFRQHDVTLVPRTPAGGSG